MRTQRIKTGFHRLGLAAALVCGVPGAMGVLAAIPAYWMWPTGLQAETWAFLLMYGAIGLILGGAAYAAARTLGWIIAGFVGDEPR